ncbi:uncharacterized protein BO96DRAFT_44737 [Aspergillus niger CBS 101883]|uniref:uncharacterized protein n=1 Tax=Aspergillus lacticoffeatus (strain CBS 101883) TaxID=1450533 RepID=UPI000D7FA142|nr:uncharacterized protein BO96DRAFT_44737 [Aspergillus niger CBS 101883]PYH57026.1 hypothetical protein BO96DRAFT_44737 [Aspergillus niger CBS 101883]
MKNKKRLPPFDYGVFLTGRDITVIIIIIIIISNPLPRTRRKAYVCACVCVCVRSFHCHHRKLPSNQRALFYFIFVLFYCFTFAGISNPTITTDLRVTSLDGSSTWGRSHHETSPSSDHVHRSHCW